MELCWDYLHKEWVFQFTVRHIHLKAGCTKMQVDLCLFFSEQLSMTWFSKPRNSTCWDCSLPCWELDIPLCTLLTDWTVSGNIKREFGWIGVLQPPMSLRSSQDQLCRGWGHHDFGVPALSDFIWNSPAFLHSKLIMICIMSGLAPHRKNTSCNGYVCLLYIFPSISLARISAS